MPARLRERFFEVFKKANCMPLFACVATYTGYTVDKKSTGSLAKISRFNFLGAKNSINSGILTRKGLAPVLLTSLQCREPPFSLSAAPKRGGNTFQSIAP